MKRKIPVGEYSASPAHLSAVQHFFRNEAACRHFCLLAESIQKQSFIAGSIEKSTGAPIGHRFSYIPTNHAADLDGRSNLPIASSGAQILFLANQSISLSSGGHSKKLTAKKLRQSASETQNRDEAMCAWFA